MTRCSVSRRACSNGLREEFRVADIRLAVSYLPTYQALVAAALPHLVNAFSPFGVNLKPEQGHVLGRDPVDTAGWRQVMDVLTQQSASQNPPAPAHVVFAEVPPGFDRSINGQLLNRARGVCAVFFGANSFQTPSPFQRLDLAAQVLIHEVGHLLNLTHGDAYASGGYADALMPTTDRQRQLPIDAWKRAVADAAARNEPPISIPAPTLTYPFGAQCRACLRDAAANPQWWPWRSAFRGDFDIATESQDTSLRVAIRNLARGEPIRAGHGIDFTLEIRNDGEQPVPLPTHIGPEFGTMVVSSVQADGGDEYSFVPDGYRCSSAKQAILPGTAIFRSFSIIPSADQAFLRDAGRHVLKVRLNSSEQGDLRQLGAAEVAVEVQASGASRESATVATELIGASRGANPLPRRDAFVHLEQLAPRSAIAYHAKYKLALLHTGRERKRLLRECMERVAPLAVRHRAGRQLVLDQLRAGRMKSWPSKAMRRAFNQPEDAEFFETLERMRDGWNALSPFANP